MNYVRIYTGPDGETHFEDLEMETTVREFTANVPPVTISQTFAGTGVFFVYTKVTPEFEVVEFHTVPRKMLVIQVKGTSEQETSVGERPSRRADDAMERSSSQLPASRWGRCCTVTAGE